MMLGERSYVGTTPVHVPPWSSAADDPSSFCLSPNASVIIDDYSALQRYLPSNEADNEFVTVDAHTCDNFRMFEFKIRKCTRGRSHDWTECPFAHPGEKARRRDPRRHHYSGSACPDFRKGHCPKGDACDHAHGVFECWLHPARYRTQPCKDGMGCRRRVCFFAHSPDQLRVLSPRAGGVYVSPPDSPPLSPMTPGPVNEMLASLRNLHLSKMKSMPSPSWPKTGPGGGYLSLSLPNTPTRPVARPGLGYFEFDEEGGEGPREMVESGRDLRAKMFEKLSKENPLDRVDPGRDPNPDVGWVSDLLK